jgi:WD40 repeat protein
MVDPVQERQKVPLSQAAASSTALGIAWASRGDLVATAHVDTTVRLWTATSGNCVRVLTGHRGSVWSADFDALGGSLVTSAEDATIRIWDVEQGSESAVLRLDRLMHDGWPSIPTAQAWWPEQPTVSCGSGRSAAVSPTDGCAATTIRSLTSLLARKAYRSRQRQRTAQPRSGTSRQVNKGRRSISRHRPYAGWLSIQMAVTSRPHATTAWCGSTKSRVTHVRAAISRDGEVGTGPIEPHCARGCSEGREVEASIGVGSADGVKHRYGPSNSTP